MSVIIKRELVYCKVVVVYHDHNYNQNCLVVLVYTMPCLEASWG